MEACTVSDWCFRLLQWEASSASHQAPQSRELSRRRKGLGERTQKMNNLC